MEYTRGLRFGTVMLLISVLIIPGISAQSLPVTVEAESGVLGADFYTTNIEGAEGITITTDWINASNPGSADRVASYEVTFPGPGEYDLYARILVGPGTWDDDSQFIPNGFGIKDPASDADWFRANGLASAGYTLITAVVGGGGSEQSGVWKWINLTKFAEGTAPKTYIVAEDSLTVTFQIGARENGLYMDKFVFGRTGLYFTVSNLINGEAGSTTLPEPGTPLAQGQDKFLGSGWDYIQAPDFPSYWNQSTPGNAGKWGSVEGTRDVMNWAVLDSTYNVAKRYNMIFKEHTLIWGAQQPNWMNDLDSAQQRQEIEEWFAALAERYDSIDLIDVVNEPIHNAPNGMIPWGTTVPNIDYAGALGGSGATGWDWVIESFRLARQYFPDSKLILNEYSVINSYATTHQMKQIANLLKEEDLIDGIGEQAHAFTTKNVSSTTLKNNLDSLAATGIPLYITEFDIDGPTDLEQLQEMQRVFPLFWEHPAVAGVTLWGYRYGLWRNEQGAYLFNQDGSERIAMTWLKAYVNDTLQDVETISITSDNGDTLIDVTGGTLQLFAEVLPLNATIADVTWSVQPSGLAIIDQSGKLVAVDNGTVTVTATAWDGSGVTDTLEIDITNQPVEVVSINITSDNGNTIIDERGDSLQLSAEVLPPDATIPDVTWSILPTGLATIDQSGKLVAVADGTVTVTATAEDGSGVTGTLEITITNQSILVESITITPDNDSTLIDEKGDTLQLSAEVLPLDATNPDVTWSVQPDSLATIDQSGKLVAIADGMVTVTDTSEDGSGVTGTLEISITNQSISVEDIPEDRIRIYPNPAPEGNFTVTGLETIRQINILDLSGKRIAAYQNEGASVHVFHLEVESGIYFLELTDGKSRLYRKIVIGTY